MIADFWLVGRPELPGGLAARARSTSARVSPAPNAPIRRKLRREMPSQYRCRRPQMVSIERSPRKADEGGGRTGGNSRQAASGDRGVRSTLFVDDDGGRGKFTSIQAAVNAAKPRDTTLVAPGTYPEQVITP